MIRIQENISLAKFTTFGIGGRARYFIKIKDVSNLKEVLLWTVKKKLKWYVLGGGSNLLVADGELNALVIKMENEKIVISDRELVCDAGVKLSLAVSKTCYSGLSGLEYFAGIPGTVGGAVYKNSHWRNHYVSDCLQKIEAVNRQGEILTINKEGLQFSYDYSSLQEQKIIITRLYFRLLPKPKKDLLATAKKINLARALNHPKGKIAGCIFKNPGQDISAGLLIDRAGLSGKKIGAVKISKQHANFFINTGKAKAGQVLELIELVQEKVRKDFKQDLQPEIFYWD